MFDVISIGDSTVDVFLEMEEASVHCGLDAKKCKLLLDYADKIPVKSIRRVAGVGNAANMAVGSARLGLTTGLYTLVGDDEDGEEIKKILTNEGVSDEYILVDKNKRSNYSVVINYKGERTILVYHEEREYELPEFKDAKWVYFTSVGEGHDKLHVQVPEFVKTSGCKLVFQPGSYQLREGKNEFKKVVEAADILIVNREEAEDILEKKGEIKDLLVGLRQLGCKTAVITNGEKGSWAADGKQVLFADVFPETKMVERTGAGDAYSTGLVAGLIKGLELGEAMRWGSANASSVVEHIGARAGLLSESEMKKRLEKCPECKYYSK